VSPTKPEPDWQAMSRIEAGLLDEFRADRVDRVEFVVSFIEPFQFSVWLGTGSDAERDAVQTATIDARIRAVAAREGMDTLYRVCTVESQETIDRDFEGSWFYRLR